jgi:hypothetical protein
MRPALTPAFVALGTAISYAEYIFLPNKFVSMFISYDGTGTVPLAMCCVVHLMCMHRQAGIHIVCSTCLHMSVRMSISCVQGVYICYMH